MLIYLNLLTEKEDGAISTIVLRGSTDNLMDDIERAVDDGVNTFKVLTRVSISCSLDVVIFKASKTIGSLLNILKTSKMSDLFKAKHLFCLRL